MARNPRTYQRNGFTIERGGFPRGGWQGFAAGKGSIWADTLQGAFALAREAR